MHAEAPMFARTLETDPYAIGYGHPLRVMGATFETFLSERWKYEQCVWILGEMTPIYLHRSRRAALTLVTHVWSGGLPFSLFT